MGKGKLLVPSDICLLEDQYTVGRRRVTLFESLGLAGILPVIHFNYTKNDKHDLRRILSRKYGVPSQATSKETDTAILDILKARQESVHRRVVSQNFMYAGVALGTALTSMSIRHYDLKTKCIVLPFLAYGSSFLGRWAGDFFTGRWGEYRRDRLLGELPAKQFFAATDN